MTRKSVSVSLLLAIALALTSFVAWAQFGSKGGSKAAPTGACTITLPDQSRTCSENVTENACTAAAQRAGGTADWAKGGSCG